MNRTGFHQSFVGEVFRGNIIWLVEVSNLDYRKSVAGVEGGIFICLGRGGREV